MVEMVCTNTETWAFVDVLEYWTCKVACNLVWRWQFDAFGSEKKRINLFVFDTVTKICVCVCLFCVSFARLIYFLLLYFCCRWLFFIISLKINNAKLYKRLHEFCASHLRLRQLCCHICSNDERNNRKTEIFDKFNFNNDKCGSLAWIRFETPTIFFRKQ